MVNRRDLISPATRRHFRDLASNVLVVREIDGAWQDEGFVASHVENHESGERRSLFRKYEDSVDWTDPQNVARALRVLEYTMSKATAGDAQAAITSLKRDGWSIGDHGRIVTDQRQPLPPDSLSKLSDASAIYDAFDRIGRTLPEHPREAIGAAKELVESTAKVVLKERGLPVSEDNLNLPALVARAEGSLHLRAAQAPTGPDGSRPVRRILGGLDSIAVGLGELRNLGYGTGHGMETHPVGLHARHAYLAVGAAQVWCTFILDTLADASAPWKASSNG